jgi:hypothetical protein
MSMEITSQAIFITNTFAAAHPEEHVRLWTQFEKEVPFSKRSGAYGMDNVAYIRWLRQQSNPIVSQFLANNIVQRSY